MAIERVLIVDHEDKNLLFFEMIVKELGVKSVVTAKTGAEGMEILEQEKSQLVITAWELPGMSGTIFVQKARSSRKRRHLPFLLYSKRMNEEDVRMAKELGFNDILAMPFNQNEARDIINRILAREANLDPVEVKARKIEGLLYEEQANDALHLIEPKFFRKGPYQARAYTVTADLWLRLGQLDKMADCLEKAIVANPEYYPAYQLKAQLLTKQEKHDEAITLLEEMMHLSPKNLSTKINLGQAYVCADRLDDAKKVFDNVIEIDKENQDAKDGQASVAIMKGDLSLATQLIAETDSGNDLARMFNNIAIGKVKKELFEEGIKIYNNAIVLLIDKAKLSRLYYNLGLAYRKKGELEKSFSNLALSYKSEPNFQKPYAALVKLSNEMKEQGLTLDKTVIKEIKALREDWKQRQPSPPTEQAS